MNQNIKTNETLDFMFAAGARDDEYRAYFRNAQHPANIKGSVSK